jgi:hypothetical protein
METKGIKSSTVLANLELSTSAIVNLIKQNICTELVQSIVGRLMTNDPIGLSKVVNECLGEYQEFLQVGDVVKTTLRPYAFWTEESIERNNSIQGDLDTATIIEVNKYANSPYRIEYEIPNKTGAMVISTTWITESQLK